MNRVFTHPIIDVKERKRVKFFFNDKEMEGYEGEVISSALIANGVKIFSYHKKGNVPQGIFCANGQCAQCSVVVDGMVVKACVTPLKEGARIETLYGFSKINFSEKKQLSYRRIEEIEIDVLVVGGGPSGLSCAVELGRFSLDVLVVDDKSKLGGKLLLQTHKFFGSVDDCYAGMRGIEIAEKLEEDIKKYPSIKVWTEASCFGVFSDKKVGVIRNNICYLIKPKVVVFATGAREKQLLFEGNTLPGVYGAGAFQTLVNRDLIKPAKRLFIVGGGNVGLIAAYHALQAGIDVVGLCEIAQRCGGYKVHQDKIKRLGVKIYTRHTVVKAEGKDSVERIIIAEVDDQYRIIEGSYKSFDVDAILIAAGLTPIDELHQQALSYGLVSYICGDACEVAEASAAMFSGKITAHNVLKHLGFVTNDVPKFWYDKLEVLKSKPGRCLKRDFKGGNRIYPVIHCYEEIPCNPCVTVCPKKSIKLSGETILSTPYFEGDCIGCFRCLVICPGLAITIVDKTKDGENPTVWIPFEVERGISKGMKVAGVDEDGNLLGEFEVIDIRNFRAEKTFVIGLRVPQNIADKVCSLRILDESPYISLENINTMSDETIVCRCERVTLGEIRRWLSKGVRDLNQLKALTRIGMGACGAKTCSQFMLSILRSEGIDSSEVTPLTKRPFFIEVPLGSLAGVGGEEERADDFSSF